MQFTMAFVGKFFSFVFLVFTLLSPTYSANLSIKESNSPLSAAENTSIRIIREHFYQDIINRSGGDVTVEFQKFLNTFDSGESVFLGAARIVISQSIKLKPGIAIVGSGPATVIENTNDEAPAFVFLTGPNEEIEGPKFYNFSLISKNGIFLNDEKLRFPGQSDAEQGYIMRAHIRGVVFKNNSNGGVAVKAVCVFDSNISDNYNGSGYDYFLDFYGSDINSIYGNRSTNVKIAHIRDRSHLTFGSTNVIHHNDFLNMAPSAKAMILTSARWAKIFDNYFEQLTRLDSNSAAIIAYNEKNSDRQFGLELIGNRFDIDATAQNIWLNLLSEPYQIVVQRNVFLSANRPGIKVADEIGYFYSRIPPTRRLIFSDNQAEARWPFYSRTSDYNFFAASLIFDSSLPGLSPEGLGAEIKVKNGFFQLPVVSARKDDYIAFSPSLVRRSFKGVNFSLKIVGKASAGRSLIRVSISSGGVELSSVDLKFNEFLSAQFSFVNKLLDKDFELRIRNVGGHTFELQSVVFEVLSDGS